MPLCTSADFYRNINCILANFLRILACTGKQRHVERGLEGGRVKIRVITLSLPHGNSPSSFSQLEVLCPRPGYSTTWDRRPAFHQKNATKGMEYNYVDFRVGYPCQLCHMLHHSTPLSCMLLKSAGLVETRLGSLSNRIHRSSCVSYQKQSRKLMTQLDIAA